MTDDDHATADAYDQLAGEYVESVESSVYHADLAFPGTVDLLPEVAGERVLDAGCGAGVYTEWLLSAGAGEVVGVDASPGMLDRARERVADRDDGRVTLRQHDLAEPLPFGDGAFDGIVSGLVLDHVADWEGTLAAFARVLDDGGFLVVTVGHPFDEFPLGDDGNYFRVERRVRDWDVAVPYYRRPLAETINPLLDAGFDLERVAEPEPTERFRERWPERYEKESRYPVFLGLRARA